jgi:hypothetical protein
MSSFMTNGLFNPVGPVATSCTPTFNIQKFCVLPTKCFEVFCVDLRKTAIISLYIINWSVFITETECVECVYCAVGTEYLNVNQVKFSL